MTNIGYDLTVIGLEEQLEKLAAFDDISNHHMRTAMQQSLLTIGANVIPLVPVGVSSRLRNSMGSEIKDLNGSLVGRFGSSLRDELYPQTMEFGRAPGAKMPPPEALVRWVHVKRLAGVYRFKSHRRVGTSIQQYQQDISTAWLIARAIHAHGIKGRHFMKQGFDKAKAAVIEYFNQALERIAKDLTNGR